MNETQYAPQETVQLDPMTALVLERMGDAPHVDLSSLPMAAALALARPGLAVPLRLPARRITGSRRLTAHVARSVV